MATNLKDIAELAGVSTATVSRALNNPEVVSESARKKIESAIAAAGYMPNINAKRLRTRKAHSILVVSPDVSDPFCASIIRGVENTAAKLGYAVLLGDTQGDIERARTYAGMVGSGHVDGLLYFGIRWPYELPETLHTQRKDLPIVYICNYTIDRKPNVGIDNVAAARLAVDHLVGLGHRRVAVIAGLEGHPETTARLRGYQEALASHGLPVADELVSYGDFSFESGITSCNALLSTSDRPTAIFCHNDRMGLGAVQALWHRGMRVPADMSIVSFDDLEFAKFSCPPLTTIAQPMHGIGVRAVELLQDLIQGNEPNTYSELLPVELIVRESTAAPRVAG